MKLIPKPAHGSREWLQLRHRDHLGNVVFGASEIPALMGQSNFLSRPELFAAKLTEPTVQQENAVFRRGNLIEPVLVAEAGAVLGVNFTTPQHMYRNGRVIATLDGTDNETSPNAIVEAKTTTRYRVRDVEDLPPVWLWQAWAQQYATMTNDTVCPVYFSVLDSEQNITVVEAPTNPQALERLAEEAEAFARAIELREPPADFDETVMDAATVAAIWKPTNTEVEIPEVEMRWLQDLVQARELIEEGQRMKEYAEAQIALLLKNHEVGTYRGVKVVSWKQQAGRTSVDTALLKEAHPAIYAEVAKQGKPFRVMRTHKVAPR